MARPISRCALAKRVTESIISSTFIPRSRKCSAIVVAANAALTRTSAGSSEVAVITIERSSASPRSRSTNSRTSRPRSPTRQMTLTSALVERAIIPSSEDLPTPEPAKMPSRWPRPTGTNASSARTPSSRRVSIGVRESGDGGAAIVDLTVSPRGAGSPSSGRPRPSRTRPSRSSPTGSRKECPFAVTGLPGPIPSSGPSGMSRVRPSRKPTTSAGIVAPFRPVAISQTSPISASRPVASITSPIRFVTRPRRRCRSARWTASSARSRTGSGTSCPQLAADDLGRPLQLLVDAGVDLALGRAQQAAAARDAALGDDLQSVEAAQRLGDALDLGAHEREVLRVHLDDDAVALDDAAERAPRHLDDELRPDLERARQDLPRERERELGRLLLDARDGVVARDLDLARGGLERRPGEQRLLARRLEPGGEAGVAALGLGRGGDPPGLGVRLLDDLRRPAGRR